MIPQTPIQHRIQSMSIRINNPQRDNLLEMYLKKITLANVVDKWNQIQKTPQFQFALANKDAVRNNAIITT